jgi:hypothetical protein
LVEVLAQESLWAFVVTVVELVAPAVGDLCLAVVRMGDHGWGKCRKSAAKLGYVVYR